MSFEPHSPEGTAERLGRLIAATEMLLEVVSELPVTLDPWHEMKVERARRLLDENTTAVKS